MKEAQILDSNLAAAELLPFRKLNDEDYCNELGKVFREHQIAYFVKDTSIRPQLFTNTEIVKEFTLNIKAEDFERAEKLMSELSQQQLGNVDSDYYLYSFTDEELLEIVAKPDEWNSLDYNLAQKILKEKGHSLTAEKIDELKKRRVNELAKPEGSQRPWIILGYVLALLGGLLSVFIGWHLSTYKKLLPDGTRVPAYSPNDRKHGSRIFVLGASCFVVIIIWKLFKR
jgi:hypothetical protein